MNSMELGHEEALFDFLENKTEPFTLDEVISYIHIPGQKKSKRLVVEITEYLDTRKIAFKVDSHQWVSRRGCFEPAVFTITPTRLELLNGIFIPGHRCVPFANPLVLPHNYIFFWKNKPVPVTTTEAPPEDLYPFYCIYGEEFAPQYIARDNLENEASYNLDPYEDPPEVSIRTMDMRSIYRESAFVPGDRFIVNTLDWKECHFSLEKTGKDKWSEAELNKWFNAAENGFEISFSLLGPGASTEEQISYAYWYGGKRMREIPAFSLEEFLFEKTDRIEVMPYGIETRFWFTGKDIPDSKNLNNNTVPPDRSIIEDILFKKNIPISEFVILSYIRDTFYRNEKDIDLVINRIIPKEAKLEESEWNIIADFVSDAMDDFFSSYSLFLDHKTGPVRQRVAELHTAVIELSTKLQKKEVDLSWLPKHSFIILSQIQGHAASLLEDLAFDDSPSDLEITAIENSLDGMIETYSDVKELIYNAKEKFKRSNLTLISGGRSTEPSWRIIQISINGLDVWRRAVISHDYTIGELHNLIQAGMGWKNVLRYQIYYEDKNNEKQYLHEEMKIKNIGFRGRKEIVYEYGPNWIIKIMIISLFQPAKDEEVRFVAGDGTAPPETITGPLRFRKMLAILEMGNEKDRKTVLQELGSDYSQNLFDIVTCNNNLHVKEKK
jgi:hypothetical protein